MDVFMEKIVAKRQTPKDFAVKAGIIIGAPVVYILFMNIPYISRFLQGLELLLIAAIVYVGYQLIRAREIEFEYIVTNGDLDIDKIVAKSKRKRIFSSNSRDFEILAKYRGAHYEPNMDDINNRIEAVSTMRAEDIYFIVLNYNGQRTIVFFQ